MFNNVKNRVAAGEILNLDHVRDFHVFGWLLTQEQKEEYSKWCKEIYARAGGKAAAASATSKSSSASASSASSFAVKKSSDSIAASKTKCALEADTLALFKKKKVS